MNELWTYPESVLEEENILSTEIRQALSVDDASTKNDDNNLHCEEYDDGEEEEETDFYNNHQQQQEMSQERIQEAMYLLASSNHPELQLIHSIIHLLIAKIHEQNHELESVKQETAKLNSLLQRVLQDKYLHKKTKQVITDGLKPTVDYHKEVTTPVDAPFFSCGSASDDSEGLVNESDYDYSPEYVDTSIDSNEHALFEHETSFEYSSSAIVQEDVAELQHYYNECYDSDGSDQMVVGSYEELLSKCESVYDDFVVQKRTRKNKPNKKKALNLEPLNITRKAFQLRDRKEMSPSARGKAKSVLTRKNSRTQMKAAELTTKEVLRCFTQGKIKGEVFV